MSNDVPKIVFEQENNNIRNDCKNNFCQIIFKFQHMNNLIYKHLFY